MLSKALTADAFVGASIILPVVDEAISVKKTVEIFLEVCDKKDIAQIILVLARNATPESVKSAEEIKREHGDLRVDVFTQTAPGLGGALREAFDRVCGSHIVTFPSDLEIDPHCIGAMIESSKKTPEKIITISRRLIKNNFRNYGKIKRIFNYFGEKFLAVLFAVRLTDISAPVQLCPTVIYNSIRWERTDFPFLLELSLKPLRLGAEFTEIPAKLSRRNEGRSNNSALLTAKYLPAALHNRFMSKKKILK